MKRFALAFALVALLALPGCIGGEFLARLLVDAQYLQVTASEYVRGVHALRQRIRQECEASLMRSVDELKAEKDETALRALLAKSYPDLVTVSLYKAARSDEEGALSRAPGCE